MKKLVSVILSSALLLGFNIKHVMAHSYQRKIKDNHVLHIVIIKPNEYKPIVVKSNDGNIGREKVSSIAKRSNAVIAINGGFFEIGADRDGAASGTLVVNGKVYGIKNQVQPLLVIKQNSMTILESNPNDIILSDVNIVSGIPMLINKGEIEKSLHNKNTDFYVNNHARTAVGKKANGDIVIVIVEHVYLRDLTTMTLGEMQSLIKEKSDILIKKYNHQSTEDITLSQLKKFLKEELAPKNGVKGLSILETAKLMKNLGCVSAINLDGGGSSTLWIKGKVVNKIFGDKDESDGVETERPVSDAIVFQRKSGI